MFISTLNMAINTWGTDNIISVVTDDYQAVVRTVMDDPNWVYMGVNVFYNSTKDIHLNIPNVHHVRMIASNFTGDVLFYNANQDTLDDFYDKRSFASRRLKLNTKEFDGIA